jgi:hypothetical protein
MHKLEEQIDIYAMIAETETILHVLNTIGFERFPNSGETMLGPGKVVMTVDNIYFYHQGHKAHAEAWEDL